MRNISIASSKSWRIPASGSSIIAVDSENDSVYILGTVEDNTEGPQTCLSKIDSGGVTNELGKFSVNGGPISVHFLCESESLAICSRAGDISLVSFENGTASFSQPEVIGSIETGITAAAWSPDETLLALVSNDGKYILMTNTFDVLLEDFLHSSKSGEDQQVNVGWGSKTTQFHGSLGKTAAQVEPVSIDTVGKSFDDDERPRVSWRGDAAYFCISYLTHERQSTKRARRVLRVYDRQGVLQSTAEPVAGLEHILSWRPSGNLIASSQRFGFDGGGAGKPDRHDVVFFERNGLRHGEFRLRETGKYKVRELQWNSNSEILSVWIEREGNDCVQLWTMGNYHWYLKQEIIPPKHAKRFTCMIWHAEDSHRLLLTSPDHALDYSFSSETYSSHADAPNDTGLVAVTDGASLLLTAFRTQNVPPPMSSYELNLKESGVPVHVSFSSTGDMLACLHNTNAVSLWKLNTKLQGGEGRPVEPIEVVKLNGGIDVETRQILVQEKPNSEDMFRVVVLGSDVESDILFVYLVSGGDSSEAGSVSLPGRGGRLFSSRTGIFWQARDGSIFSVSKFDDVPTMLADFDNDYCFFSEVAYLSQDETMFIGKSDSGKLKCANGASHGPVVLSSNVTSYTVAAGFIIYTTSAHDVHFASVRAVHDYLMRDPSVDQSLPQWDKRRVERGSRIVTAVPSNMSLVLQMPRGNLETINPRPLVLAVVRQDITALRYRKAFLECRKHRVDLTILVEHDPKTFYENISLFVDQINEVDHLNLFLTGLAQSDLEEEKISRCCDALRSELDSLSILKYVNSILTACIMRKPADYESGLGLLLRIREQNQELVEDAVKYIIFLVDADKLFDTALGMYDFSLVLLIAQHSQRDPREYLPFLRELRALPRSYQLHKIDDHLKRYTKALENLHEAGSDYFDEALRYIEKHRLYEAALALWKDDEAGYERILDIYGDYVFERREFGRAALLFVEAKKDEKALISYERALLWREAFELASCIDWDDEKIVDMAHRISDDLISKKRYEEAGRVLLDYAGNTRQCILALVQGNQFSEARRIIQTKKENNLVVEILYPGFLDSRAQITEDIEEMRAQLFKQVERLRELRVKKEEEPDAFYGVEDDPALHDVDVVTDVSMAPTAFTRYTVAPTTTSKSSKRSSRSKRKMERKVGSGRKGTIDEEEYLLKSIGKLVTRFELLQSDVANLIPHLLRATEEHRSVGKNLQKEVSAFQADLQNALDEVWPSKSNGEGDQVDQADGSTWAERMEAKKRDRKLAVEAIVKPVLNRGDDTVDLSILRL